MCVTVDHTSGQLTKIT